MSHMYMLLTDEEIKGIQTILVNNLINYPKSFEGGLQRYIYI